MNQNIQPQGRGITLNSLLDEQRSLNMRMLLALQLRDQAAQEELRASLEDVAARIEALLSGGLPRPRARKHRLHRRPDRVWTRALQEPRETRGQISTRSPVHLNP